MDPRSIASSLQQVVPLRMVLLGQLLLLDLSWKESSGLEWLELALQKETNVRYHSKHV